jgi:hypothetical protein
MKGYAEDRYEAKFFNKPTPLMWVIYVFLRVATLGGQKDFMTRFTTTIGPRVYFSEGLENIYKMFRVLAHEMVHMLQALRMGFIPFALKYATREGRAELEFEGYQMSNAVAIWRGASQESLERSVEKQVPHFTTSTYLWMCTDEKRVRQRLWADIQEVRSGMYAMRSPLAHDVKRIVQTGSL